MLWCGIALAASYSSTAALCCAGCDPDDAKVVVVSVVERQHHGYLDRARGSVRAGVYVRKLIFGTRIRVPLFFTVGFTADEFDVRK